MSTTTLKFVCVALGEYVAPTSVKLSSPTASFGASRTDTGAPVVADNTAMSASGSLYSYAITDPAANLIYRYYVEVVVDGVTYYVARTTQFALTANLIIGRYCTSQLIEEIFGADNVHKWLAMDSGDEAVDYAMREYRHIEKAEQRIDDELKGAYAAVPYEEDVPPTITRLAAELAGVFMYEGRGIIDTNNATGLPEHKYAAMRRDAFDMLRRIKNGHVRLDGGLTPTQHPKIACE